MRVLLLGATGLLGHNVLRQLLNQDYEVVTLVRRGAKIVLPQGGWHTVEGSALDYATLSTAAEGCQAVINCVGATNMAMLRRDDYRPANAHICALLVRLAEEKEMAAVVHVSTVNTIGYGSAEKPADEAEAMREPFLGSFYADTKREGEELLIEAARRLAKCRFVILNPGYMIGPYDVRPSSGALLDAAYRMPLMVAPKGGKAFVYVGDVAEAAVNAIERGRSGQRYLLTNLKGELTFREFFRLQASTLGYRQWCISLPNGLLRLAGWIGDALRGIGIRTALSTQNVRQLTVGEHYNNQLARRELYLRETPIAEAIRQYFTWKKHDRS